MTKLVNRRGHQLKRVYKGMHDRSVSDTGIWLTNLYCTASIYTPCATRPYSQYPLVLEVRRGSSIVNRFHYPLVQKVHRGSPTAPPQVFAT